MATRTSSPFSFSKLISSIFGKREEATHDVTTVSVLALTDNKLGVIRSKLSEDASFFCAFSKDTSPLKLPPEMIVSHHIKGDGCEYLCLSNGSSTAASGGITGGYSIRLPDAVEAQASGHPVTVKVAARAIEGSQSRFALAYSTNEVGNSGWRWFDATPDWSVHAMEWDVPVMRKGNGDFIGILPDIHGKPGTEFGCLAVFVAST